MEITKDLLEQIKTAWSKINETILIELELNENEVVQEEELQSFVHQFKGLSPFVEVIESSSKVNRFKVSKKGESSRLIFEGIPLGHELTSFVLAPLQLVKEARMPDEFTLKRIASISEQLNVESYVSLTCENCPIVVQAFNLIAALNDNVTHTMIEGSFAKTKVETRGVQSVPTVYINDQLFSTGRQEMSQILEKIEDSYASAQQEVYEDEIINADVVIVGAGPAGASAAIYTARKGLKTVIISENVGGQVKETKAIENRIGSLSIQGPELAEELRNHILDYDIRLLENQKVESVKKERESFKIELKAGLSIVTKSIIAATGARWRELNVPGEKEYLGNGVAFCPHCDGPFFKNKEIAVVGGGNSGVEAALDLANICKKVTLLEYGGYLMADQLLVEKLLKHPSIEVITDAKTNKIIGDGKTVTALEYFDLKNEEDKLLNVSGIFIQIGLLPNSSWLENEVELSDFGEVVINERNQTSTPGIFAAGDVSTVPYKQIVIAMGEGAKAGLSAFEYLLKQ